MNTVNLMPTSNVVPISEGHRLRAIRQAEGRQLVKAKAPRVIEDRRAVRRRPRRPAA